MKTYHVFYDPRYKIPENKTVFDAEDLTKAKEMAHEYAQEHSPTNFDFSNVHVVEQG